jgi:hypothetical protein
MIQWLAKNLNVDVSNLPANFPWLRDVAASPDVMFKKLQEEDYPLEIAPYRLRSYNSAQQLYLPAQYLGIPVYVVGIGQQDSLSDHFMEDLRLQVRHGAGNKPPIEEWTGTNRKVFNTEVMQAKNFNPFWAKSLLKTLLATDKLSKMRWLDISAGWGDRLLTAMALDMEYLGFDPNAKLFPRYQQMLDTLGKPTEQNFYVEYPIPSTQGKYKQKIYQAAFENISMVPESVDVVLTSIPYFNLEVYEVDNPEQSINKFPTYEEWMRGFVFVSIESAWQALKIGGYLILHLGDAKNMHLAEPTNLYIEDYCAGAQWQGILAIQGTAGYQRPVWVWKKGTVGSKWKPEQVRSLAKLYPQFF